MIPDDLAATTLDLGRDLCGDLEAALRREWLVADGTGSYACGTVATARTRAYHGLLVAATDPPAVRTLVVGGLDEEVVLPSGRSVRLHTQEWADGTVAPRGHLALERFRLDRGVPVWRYALDGALLERRVLMPHGSRSTLVLYTLTRGGGAAVRLRLRPLCAWRDHHGRGRDGPLAQTAAAGEGALRVDAGGGTLYVRMHPGWVESAAVDRYARMRLRAERERGLDDVDDLDAAGTLTADLADGATVAVSLSLDEGVSPQTAGEALRTVLRRADGLVVRAGAASAPAWVRHLVIAADAFVVDRGGMPSVIAGYPWFTDWGRDTFISLPGLALATGRPEVAAGLLRGFARHLVDGLLPNRFPDHGGVPEPGTVDATLWFVEALRAHVEDTADQALVDDLWPALEGIVDAHLDGTVLGIGVDPADSLLRAGEPGRALTWMDARVDGWVVTPRIGKPVEVNALWYSALRTLAWLRGGRPSRHDHDALAGAVRRSFERFWNPAEGYCLDVLDGPDGDDASIRPNAVVAASLVHTPLSAERVRAVVERARRDLLTSLGLRTLAPSDTAYAGHYTGDRRSRDGAYHRGTAWPWLLGPMVAAHLRSGGDAGQARSMLDPIAAHLADAGLGSVSEIADGDAPHLPRGCPWQAWSVAEALRAWRLCEAALAPATGEGSRSPGR